uniref:Uncharacterized protein n=1 Tax=Arundo donax TaxID=35708 RepID=A0A0A9BBR8_ARUDO
MYNFAQNICKTKGPGINLHNRDYMPALD